MIEKYFEDGSKNVGIDVTLHAEFDFNIIFDRLRVEMGHLENTLFAYGFLKVTPAILKVVFGEPKGFAVLLVIMLRNHFIYKSMM